MRRSTCVLKLDDCQDDYSVIVEVTDEVDRVSNPRSGRVKHPDDCSGGHYFIVALSVC